jgi:glycosyltransferase involved in cell wall biosynthesis
LLEERTPGVTYARNRGFDAAAGDVLARIDADTVVSTGWAAAIHEAFRGSQGIHGIAGPAGLAAIPTADRPIGCGVYRAFRVFHELTVGDGPLMYGHNMAITRAAWHAIRPIVTTGDAEISEDIDVALALLHVGGTVAYVPGMLVTVDMARTVRPRKLARYYRSDQLTKAKYRRLRAESGAMRPSAAQPDPAGRW